ncbi:MAG: type VI secretion protein, partial [Actinomycetota bacterium]|nr:type VI secretion protein [Actinomycetota bacterium]
LAHQHLGQLPRELREAISTNARSKIFFTASPEDARDLSRHTAPRLTDHDLAHLGAYHAAARLVLHGEQAQPFTIRTQPLPPAIPGRAREIRSIARRASRSRTASTTPLASGSQVPPGQQPTSSHPAPSDRRNQTAVHPRNIDPRRHR